MVKIVGKYIHEKNENLDNYFKAIGVPYIPRKMMGMSSPIMEISNEKDEWTITNTTMLRTTVLKFTLGVEYEEHMPGTTIKSTTNLEGDKLVTVSTSPDNTKVLRIYEFSDTGCILTMKHEATGTEARRYFKRE